MPHPGAILSTATCLTVCAFAKLIMYTNHSDEAAVGLLDTDELPAHRSSRQPRWLPDGKNAAIALLTVANLIWMSVILTRAGTQNVDVGSMAQAVNHSEIGGLLNHPAFCAYVRHASSKLIRDTAIVPALPRTAMRFHWDTPYSSPNDTQSGLLWDKIDTAHGGVAMPHLLAAEKQWQPSMSVPGDDSKGLYLLEGYHQLHCLVSPVLPKGEPSLHYRRRSCASYSSKAWRARPSAIQYSMLVTASITSVRYERSDGFSLDPPRADSCLNQFIICHADNTPLYTTGDHTSGDGQLHMCNDWSALRDYATEHSACFHDRVGNESLASQFGQCDDGTDGIVVDTSR